MSPLMTPVVVSSSKSGSNGTLYAFKRKLFIFKTLNDW
jgi:hypothetical protein